MKIVAGIKKYWLFILLGVLVVFLYTFNLARNSRFIWDESRALVDMHRIWENKQITFVGPISSDNLEMFPSLSYYMYMPATVLTNFDPLGPAYMAAFYGFLAWLFLTIAFIKKFGVSSKSILLSLFVATISPVMVASRWAWNPNPVLFWMSIFAISLLFDNPFLIFLGGLSFGASLYHHYLAAFGIIPAILLLPIFYKDSKDSVKKIIITIAGFLVAIVPFALFELKNHYFLNSSTFLSANERSFLSLTTVGFFERFWNAVVILSTMFVPNNIVTIISFLVILLLIFFVYKKDKIIRYSFLSLIFSLLLFGFVKITYSHYQYSQVSLVILFIFRFISLNKNHIWKFFLTALLVFSMFSAYRLITSYTWQGDIVGVRNVTSHILKETEPKTNVAALAGKDSNLTGQRFRDMALIGGKTLDAYNLYPESKILFVVSSTKDESVIRNDQAWELESFKGSTITDIWQVSDFPMYLYRFEK